MFYTPPDREGEKGVGLGIGGGEKLGVNTASTGGYVQDNNRGLGTDARTGGEGEEAVRWMRRTASSS